MKCNGNSFCEGSYDGQSIARFVEVTGSAGVKEDSLISWEVWHWSSQCTYGGGEICETIEWACRVWGGDIQVEECMEVN